MGKKNHNKKQFENHQNKWEFAPQKEEGLGTVKFDFSKTLNYLKSFIPVFFWLI